MHWQFTPLAIYSILAATIAMALVVFAWRRRTAPGAWAFIVLMLALSEWAWSYSFGLFGADTATKLRLPGFLFIGVTVAAAAWFVFCLQYTGRMTRLSLKWILFLSLMPILTVVGVWTNDTHHLIWQKVDLAYVLGYPVLDLKFGYGFWAHTVYSYSLVAIGTYYILRAFLKSPRYLRGQKVILLMGVSIPWIANFAQLAGISPIKGLDLTPLAVAATGMMLAWGLSDFHLLDLAPIARAAVLDSMNDGVIVLDTRHVIADVNGAAAAIFNVDPRKLIGQPAVQALSPWCDLNQCMGSQEVRREILIQSNAMDRYYDWRVSKLRNPRGMDVGCLIVLRDISAQKLVEDDLRVRERSLTLLNESEHHRSVQLSLLYEVSRMIAATLDESEIIHLAVSGMVEKFGFAEAAISLLVDENQLEVKVIAGTKDFGIAEGFRQQIGQGIIGQAAETRTAYLSNDLSQDAFYYNPLGTKTGSAVGLPLLREDRLIGVLYAESASTDAFTVQDVQVFETLAAHVATAIQNARLYARARDRLQEMTVLQQVSQAVVSSLVLKDILQKVVELMQASFGYKYVSIYQLERNELHLWVQANYPEDKIIRAIPISKGIIGRTIRTKQLQFLRHVADDPEFLRASDEIQSEICIPLIKDRTVLGAINIETGPERTLTEDDVMLLQIFAGQLTIAIENARLFTIERQRARELDALNTATDSLLTTLELGELLREILSAAISAIPNAEKGALFLVDPITGELRVREVLGYTDDRVPKLIVEIQHSAAAQSVRQRKPLLVSNPNDASLSPRQDDIPELHTIRSTIGAPLITGNNVIGAISLDSSLPSAFNPADLRLLVSFAATATAAIRNAQLHSDVQTLAITDALTGLYNLRGLHELGRREVDRARRFDRPLACIYFDLDHFKKVNDTYSHAVGDEVLRTLAERCRLHLRDVDILARYGGEEFVALLPETEFDAARMIAERLRACVAEEPFVTSARPLPITISLGVVRQDKEVADLPALLHRADLAMYAAKQSGRNRVVAS